jgi:membrane dipeptidase
MATMENLRSVTQGLLRSGIVWDNHACMPLRSGASSYLSQLERARQAGINVI